MKWTKDIGHGEMFGKGQDETLIIDTCNPKYVHQGKSTNRDAPCACWRWR